MKYRHLIRLVLTIICLVYCTSVPARGDLHAASLSQRQEADRFHIQSADDCSLTVYETVIWGQQKYAIKKGNLYCTDITTNTSNLLKKRCDLSYGWWRVQNHLIYIAYTKKDGFFLYSLNLDTGQEDSYCILPLSKSSRSVEVAYVEGIDTENGTVYLIRNNKIICLSLELKETARCSIKGAGPIEDVLWGQTTYITDGSKLYQGNIEQGFSSMSSLPQKSLCVDLLGTYGDYIYGVNIYPAYAGTTIKQFFQMSLKNNRKKVLNKKDYARQYQMIDNHLFCSSGFRKTSCYTLHEDGSITKTTYKVPFYATDGEYIYYIINDKHSTQRISSYCLADGSKKNLDTSLRKKKGFFYGDPNGLYTFMSINNGWLYYTVSDCSSNKRDRWMKKIDKTFDWRICLADGSKEYLGCQTE